MNIFPVTPCVKATRDSEPFFLVGFHANGSNVSYVNEEQSTSQRFGHH